MIRIAKDKYSKHIHFVACMILIIYVGVCHAQVAEIVWVDSAIKGSQIMHSQLIEDEWQTPKTIFSSENRIVTPTISRKPDGSALLVWSEISDLSSQLKYSLKNISTTDWGPSKDILGGGTENLAATTVTDSEGWVWLFWSSNQGDDDDIFYTRMNAEGWINPQQLNSDNDVPDILPNAYLNSAGDIVVNWQSLDLDLLAYKTISITLELDSTVSHTLMSADKDLTLNDIELPEFLPAGYAILYFPNNISTQSFPIN